MIGPELKSVSLHLAPGFLLTKTGYNTRHMREIERCPDFEMHLFANTNVMIKYKGERTIVWGSVIKEGVLA